MSQARGRLSPNPPTLAGSRLILIVATFAFALAASAPAAQAKGIAQATVCGADGCIDVTSRLHGPRDCTDCSAEQLMTAMPGSAHPSRQAPDPRIVLGFGHPDQGRVEGPRADPLLVRAESSPRARRGPTSGPGSACRRPHSPWRYGSRATSRPTRAASMPRGRPKLTGTLVPAPAADARPDPAASGESSATRPCSYPAARSSRPSPRSPRSPFAGATARPDVSVRQHAIETKKHRAIRGRCSSRSAARSQGIRCSVERRYCRPQRHNIRLDGTARNHPNSTAPPPAPPAPSSQHSLAIRRSPSPRCARPRTACARW